VLQNGAPLAPSVPANPATRLGPIPVGASVSVELTVVNSNGTPVNLAELGVSCVLTVKQSPQQGRSVQPGFTKTATLPTNASVYPRINVVEFSVVPLDTQNLLPGTYDYDVWLLNTNTSPTTREPLIPLSPCVLTPAITLP
jgi:hypothetical protein